MHQPARAHGARARASRSPSSSSRPADCAMAAAAALMQRQVLLLQARRRGAVAANAANASANSTTKPRLLYEALAFDLDGTLQEGNIPFADMRRRTEIPVGDLFTVLESAGSESSTDEDDGGASASDTDGDGDTSPAAALKAASAARVRKAMDVILEIEAAAAATTAPMRGLAELLRLLESRDAKVALVTRNTPRAVEHFFGAVFAQAGVQDAAEAARWRALFDPVITRHDRFVKPDRRLLMDVAERWGLGNQLGKVLMVGDSLEDVEIGNACGAASCLIAGGGNEVGAAGAAAPPPGAVPTFAVNSLLELRDLLVESAPAESEGGKGGGGNGANNGNNNGNNNPHPTVRLGWALGTQEEIAVAAAAADPRSPGAPAPGLPFVDWCCERGAFKRASVSFPRIAAAAGGFAACGDRGDAPDRVLHVGCAEGALTKLLASSGLLCFGADADVTAAARRGLAVVPLAGGGGGGSSGSTKQKRADARALAKGDLEAARRERGPFDAVLLLPPGGPLEELSLEAACEAARALRPGGALACEVSRDCCVEGLEADVLTALDGAGMDAVEIGRVAGGGSDGGASGDVVLRVLARRRG